MSCLTKRIVIAIRIKQPDFRCSELRLLWPQVRFEYAKLIGKPRRRPPETARRDFFADVLVQIFADQLDKVKPIVTPQLVRPIRSEPAAYVGAPS